MKKIKYLAKSLSKLWILLIGLGILSAWEVNNVQSEKWVAPASADKIKNPLKGDEAAIKAGSVLYKQMCAICHGNKGKGDGMAGMSLTPRPSNFTKTSIQEQSDGALYWKLTTGRSPMAAYENILKENQRWQLVNFIRTFK
jgi:mono/diheme cytochrome c family protein